MNKKITIVLILLCAICLSFALVGCNNDASELVKGVEGFDAAIDNDAMTITFSVDCLTNTFLLSKFNVADGATLKAYYDEEKSKPVENELTLEFGENVFYIEIIGKDNTSLTYKVTITKEEPNGEIDPTKTVKAIEVAQAKTTYYVGEFFTPGIMKVTYTDGSEALVRFSSTMVSGFDTSKVGQVSVTVTVNGKSATYTINVIEVAVPDYSHVSPANLDADVFVNKVCDWVAIISTMDNSSEKYYQEDYDYWLARFRAESEDILYAWADNVANCGISTELILKVDSYVKPILIDVRDMAFEIRKLDSESDGFAYQMTQAIVKKERLIRIRDNTKELLNLAKPEYFATLFDGELDKLLKETLLNLHFDDYTSAAENTGNREVIEFWNTKVDDFSKSTWFSLLLDYNSFAYACDEVLNLVSTVLDYDIDALSSAVLCVVDITSMDKESLGNLAAGKGKYSYRDIISNVNTVGEFITTLVDNMHNHAITRFVATNLINSIFAYVEDSENIADIFTSLVNFDLYKAVGTLLKDLTVTDITNIYMDYNDWQVAVNNELSEETCNAKFATLIVRVAKIVGNALDNSGDRESIVGSVGKLVDFALDFYNSSTVILSILDKADGIADPTKISAQQATEIYQLYESMFAPNDTVYHVGYKYTILDNGFQTWETEESKVTTLSMGYIKINTDKSKFLDSFSKYSFYKWCDGENGVVKTPLTLTESNVIGFDSSSAGFKQLTLMWEDVSVQVDYFVCSSNVLSQMTLDYMLTSLGDYQRRFEKDSQVALNNIYYSGWYTYIDPVSMRKIEIDYNDCSNLRIVGLDTSKEGEGIAFIVGEHEMFGVQVFPFKYLVYDNYSELYLERMTYKVGDKVQGWLHNKELGALELEEENLFYDFSTPGYKTVTYTYGGKKYTAVVRVYSEDYAKEISYLNSCGGMEYIKGGSFNEFVFGDTSIEFNGLDTLRLRDMTLSQAREALKAIDSNYDITVEGFDLAQDVGTYKAVVRITKAGEFVKSASMNYSIIDSITWNPYQISIYINDGNDYSESVINPSQLDSIQIERVLIKSGHIDWICCISNLEELSKFGELK
ncbi:MAG: bacterial Ig-like domain-containing protein, partial [Clostridia bacterium]|nr:bacterial Ig-like domain-containing protein [Clostridia bacterium]